MLSKESVMSGKPISFSMNKRKLLQLSVPQLQLLVVPFAKEEEIKKATKSSASKESIMSGKPISFSMKISQHYSNLQNYNSNP